MSPPETLSPPQVSPLATAKETITHSPTIFDQARLDGVVFPPSEIDSNEPPLETYLHLQQIILLLTCLEWHWRDRQDFFAAGNLTIYYSPQQRKSEEFRGPDFFVVLDTHRKPRRSWVVWEEEGKYPHVIIEILSPRTAKVDRNLKKDIYENTFRTPDYFWFDPDTLEFAGFHLLSGHYEPILPNPQGYLWSQQLDLYLGIYQEQLRFFTPTGELVLSPSEIATLISQQVADARQQAEIATQEVVEARQEVTEARQQAERESQRAERLAAKLRELNVDPEELG